MDSDGEGAIRYARDDLERKGQTRHPRRRDPDGPDGVPRAAGEVFERKRIRDMTASCAVRFRCLLSAGHSPNTFNQEPPMKNTLAEYEEFTRERKLEVENREVYFGKDEEAAQRFYREAFDAGF